jgi:hypothetical protein
MGPQALKGKRRACSKVANTHTHTTKASKRETKINVCEGAKYNANETRIKAITTQTQNIKYLFGLHVWKGQ